MVEYRPIPEERHEEFQRQVDYAFRPEEGAQEYAEEDLPPRMGDLRGIFDGDTLLSGCILQEFDAGLRGERITLGGYSAVITPPQHRRQGHVETLLRESLSEYRDRDVSFAALWPFKTSFYAQFGWGTANRYAKCELEADALAFVTDEVDAVGEFWEASPDDWERLQPVHRADREGQTLAIERTEAWWRHRVFERFGEEWYVHAWDDEDGEPAGYVVYRFEGEGHDRTLRVRELAARSDRASLQILRYLYRHAAQVGEIELPQPPRADLLDRVANNSDVDCELHTGPMIRVVDVPGALEDVPYLTATTERLTIAVSDSLIDENDGTFRLDVADGTPEARPAPDVDDPDVTTDIATLSQLLVGYHDVDDAERLGSLSCTENVRETLEDLFPPETVLLGEFF